MSPIDDSHFEKYYNTTNKSVNGAKTISAKSNNNNFRNKPHYHNSYNNNDIQATYSDSASNGVTGTMSPKQQSNISLTNMRSSSSGSSSSYPTPPPAQALPVNINTHHQHSALQLVSPSQNASSHAAALAAYNATLHHLAANFNHHQMHQQGSNLNPHLIPIESPSSNSSSQPPLMATFQSHTGSAANKPPLTLLTPLQHPQNQLSVSQQSQSQTMSNSGNICILKIFSHSSPPLLQIFLTLHFHLYWDL